MSTLLRRRSAPSHCSRDPIHTLKLSRVLQAYQAKRERHLRKFLRTNSRDRKRKSPVHSTEKESRLGRAKKHRGHGASVSGSRFEVKWKCRYFSPTGPTPECADAPRDTIDMVPMGQRRPIQCWFNGNSQHRSPLNSFSLFHIQLYTAHSPYLCNTADTTT